MIFIGHLYFLEILQMSIDQKDFWLHMQDGIKYSEDDDVDNSALPGRQISTSKLLHFI